jgi:hypothetical protein
MKKSSFFSFYSLVLIIILYFSISSCSLVDGFIPAVTSGSSSTHLPPPTSTPTFTSKPKLASTRTIHPSETEVYIWLTPQSSATATPLPTKSPIQPKVVKFCPPSQGLSLSDLGLDPNLLIVVQPYDEQEVESGIFTISGSDSSPKLVPHSIPPKGWTFTWFRTIDGMLFESHRRPDDGSGYEIWISSLDGEINRKVATIPDDESGLIFGDEVYVYGPGPEFYGDWKDDHVPLRRIHIDTGEIEEFPQLPEGAIFDGIFDVEGELHAMYYKGLAQFEEISLFSYKDEVSIPIYSWLLSKDYVNFHTANLSFGDKFSGIISRDYGFDIGPPLSLNELQQDFDYSQIMQAVIMPDDPTYEFDTWFVMGWLGGNQVLIDHTDKDLMSSIYILDFDRNILFDLCMTLPMDYWWDISPEGKYLSVTTLAHNVPEEPWYSAEETMIINLENGLQVSLGRIHVVGWLITTE